MSELRNIHVPTVSVVIPTRNWCDMLARAIRSALVQTIQDLEVIVVDDASTYDVEAVVKSFAGTRLVLVRHQAARGGGAARNTGIRHARGEFVAFLDDADEWLPEKLELQLVRFGDDRQIGLVCTGIFYIKDLSGCTLKVSWPVDRRDKRRHLLRQNVIGTTSTIMVRRACFTAGLKFDENLKGCQDWDLYLKIMQHYTLAHINRPLVRHHVHDNRITRNYADLLQGHRAILRSVITQHSCFRGVISYHHFKIGKLALQFGDKTKGRQELLRSLSVSPWRGANFLYLLGSLLHPYLYRTGSLLFQRLKAIMVNVGGSERSSSRGAPRDRLSMTSAASGSALPDEWQLVSAHGRQSFEPAKASLISIVIPLFNKALHIENTIRSVFAQSYQDFQLIIVNDGSTDRGLEIVRDIRDPRVIIIDQANAGVSVARNHGIDAAKGELVAFLDADDLWNRDFLATIIRLKELHPRAGLYATAYQILNGNNRMIDPHFAALPFPPWEGIIPNYFHSAALGKPPVWTSACCVPQRILAEVGGFAVDKRMGEDLDLWGRIALRYPIAFSSYKGAVYCQNTENRACSFFRATDEHPFIETVKALRCAGSIPANIDDDVELYLARLRWENMRQHVLAGNLKRARELAAENNKGRNFPLRWLFWGSRLNGVTRLLWHFLHPSVERT